MAVAEWMPSPGSQAGQAGEPKVPLARKPDKLIDEMLRCVYTDAELLELGKQMARAANQKREMEARKQEVTKRLAAEISEKDAELGKLTDRVSQGYEYRNVECGVWYDTPKPGRVGVYRLDTGELVSERRMSESELQMTLVENPNPVEPNPAEPDEEPEQPEDTDQDPGSLDPDEVDGQGEEGDADGPEAAIGWPEPNAAGCYDLADAETLISEFHRQGGQASINVLKVRQNDWISAIHYETGAGGYGEPLTTSKKPFPSRAEAIADAATRLLKGLQDRKLATGVTKTALRQIDRLEEWAKLMGASDGEPSTGEVSRSFSLQKQGAEATLDIFAADTPYWEASLGDDRQQVRELLNGDAGYAESLDQTIVRACAEIESVARRRAESATGRLKSTWAAILSWSREVAGVAREQVRLAKDTQEGQ